MVTPDKDDTGGQLNNMNAFVTGGANELIPMTDLLNKYPTKEKNSQINELLSENFSSSVFFDLIQVCNGYNFWFCSINH